MKHRDSVILSPEGAKDLPRFIFPYGGLITGVLLALTFPNFSLSPLAWVAFVPWLFDLYRASDMREAIRSSAVAGLLFFLISCSWTAYVSVVGYVLLSAFLGLYFIPFGILVHALYQKRQSVILWGSFCWVGLELLRGVLLTGFPWNTLASSQAQLLPLIQMASVAGAYGVSFVVIMANLALFEGMLWAWGKPLALTKQLCCAGLTLIILVFIFGYRELRVANAAPDAATASAPIKIAAIQPNIPQEQKWDSTFYARTENQLRELTLEAGKTKPLLIAWPETSIPGEMRHDDSVRRFAQDLAKSAGAPLLVGNQDSDGAKPPKYFNAAHLVDAERGIVESYRKMHLVPFGEFLPFARWLPFLRRIVPIPEDFSPGKELTVFSLRGPTLRWLEADGTLRSEIRMIRFGAVICFEDIFSGLFRNLCQQNLDFVVNLTNDGWFRHSGAAMQHANLAVFRAVENRIHLLRATNTGYTCLIDPYGRVVADVRKDGSIFVPGIISADVTPLRLRTIYSQMGDFFARACLILAIMKAFLLVKDQRRKC